MSIPDRNLFLRCGGCLLALWLALSCSGNWTPQILEEGSYAYLPDFSYAGYHCGEAEPPRLAATMSIADYGAVPDDGKDDTEAIQAALAAAHAADGRVVLAFEPGRYILREVVRIKRSNLVLQGAGSAAGGTLLYIPVPCRRGEAIVLVNGGSPARDGKVLAVPASGTRGEYRMTCEKAPRFKAGDLVRLRWRNRGDGRTGFLYHLYGTDELEIGPKISSDSKTPFIGQDVEIIKVEGLLVYLKKPLIHDVKAAWGCDVVRPVYLQEIGVEGFCFEFAFRDYNPHHLQLRYNAVAAYAVYNCWFRDIRTVNSDQALFLSGANVTASQIETVGRKGYYGIYTRNADYILVKDFHLGAPSERHLSAGSFVHSTVFSGGTLYNGCLDQRSGMNHQNLFEDIEIVREPQVAGKTLGQFNQERDSYVPVDFPGEWQVFGPLPAGTVSIPETELTAIPYELRSGRNSYPSRLLGSVSNGLDFSYLYGGYGLQPLTPGEEPGPCPRPGAVWDLGSMKRIAVAYCVIEVPRSGKVLIGTGADWWQRWYIDGRECFSTRESGNRQHPIAVHNHQFVADLEKGEHLVCIVVEAGAEGWSLFASGRVGEILTGSAALYRWNIFDHGGERGWKPAHGAYNTFWNLKISFPGIETVAPPAVPIIIGEMSEGPKVRLVGICGEKPVVLKYGPQAYMEGIGNCMIGVKSLYEYQFRKRYPAEK